jgi:hypothetical protein
MPRMKKPGQNKVVTVAHTTETTLAVVPPPAPEVTTPAPAEAAPAAPVEAAPVEAVTPEVTAPAAPAKTKTKKAKTAKKDDHEKFYKDYDHVVPGSVREPTKDDLKQVTKSHGKVCDIKCVDCKTVFVRNTQDAFQSLRCEACKAEHVKQRRASRSKKAKKGK